MAYGHSNRIARLSSWQALPMLAWLLFVLIAAEPLFCQSGCQLRPHFHEVTLGVTADGFVHVDVKTFTQAFVCLFSDPLIPTDSQQPAMTPGSNHEHLAVQILLVLLLTITRLFGISHVRRYLPYAWISAPLDRPPIYVRAYA